MRPYEVWSLIKAYPVATLVAFVAALASAPLVLFLALVVSPVVVPTGVFLAVSSGAVHRRTRRACISPVDALNNCTFPAGAVCVGS